MLCWDPGLCNYTDQCKRRWIGGGGKRDKEERWHLDAHFEHKASKFMLCSSTTCLKKTDSIVILLIASPWTK